jgi:SAM-dependent methyltransferase
MDGDGMIIEKEEKEIIKKRFSKKNPFKYPDDKLSDIVLYIQSYKNEEFSSLNLPRNKDLIPGQYEGGIKVWECSLDLCNFLPGYIGWYDLNNLKVLELGCGHGLPGIYFLLRNSYVMFQDFNEEIIDKITVEYINQINNSKNINLFDKVGMISGDWAEFKERSIQEKFTTFTNDSKEVFNNTKYDLIISADTLYNASNYESFYRIIKENLNKPGICFLCSKKFYFGVGGGTSQFIEYVESQGDFEIKVIKEINDGMSNIRQILEIRNN